MPIGRLLKRWIEVLALLLLDARGLWRVRRSLVVSLGNDAVTLKRTMPDGSSASSTASPGQPVPDAIVDFARRAIVTLELPSDRVVSRKISVPALAQEYLSGIVNNQISRLSPWHSEKSIFGFNSNVNNKDPAVLDVRVLITSLAVVERAREDIAAMGLRVDRVAARDPDDAIPSQNVTLWSREADVAHEEVRTVTWRLGAALACCAAFSVGLGLWAHLSASAISEETDALSARAKLLQHQVQQNAAAAASANPRERAWIEKETAPAAVIILDAISRALPDTAYLTEMHMEKGRLRVAGLSNDAAALIAVLGRSGQFADVHFFAPTTRSSDGIRFNFYIEAKIETDLGMGEQ
jgi:general secretion pathway protein L